MKKLISSLLLSVGMFLVTLVFIATPALADNDPNQRIRGKMSWEPSHFFSYLWIGGEVKELQSAVVSGDFPIDPTWGEYGRSLSTVFRYNQDLRTGLVARSTHANWTVSKELTAGTTVYYRMWVEVNQLGSGDVWKVNGVTHTGSAEITGSMEVSQLYGATLDFWVDGEPRVDTFKPFDFTIYATFSLDPNPPLPGGITLLPASVYIDTVETLAGESGWVANLPSFFSALNAEMAQEGTNKRFYWNGAVTPNQDTEPWDLGDPDNPCSMPTDETGVKIWFSTYGGDLANAAGYSKGLDCLGHGTMVIRTGLLNPWSGVIPTSGTVFNLLLDVALHEFVHTRGGFLTEGYNFKNVPGSGLQPYLNIDVSNPNDKWWNGQLGGEYKTGDMRVDYMSGQFNGVSSEQFLTLNGFSQLSRDFINHNTGLGRIWVNQRRIGGNVVEDVHIGESDILGTGKYLHVKQLDGLGNGEPGIHIKAWFVPLPDVMGSDITCNVNSALSDAQHPTGDFVTDSNGEVDIPWGDLWGGGVSPQNRCFSTVTIKSYADAEGTAPYGIPEIVTSYNLELKRIETGSAYTNYNVTLLNAAANYHTVTFNGNGATTGSMAPQTDYLPAKLNYVKFSRTGYLFSGWNTEANGTGTAYADQAIYNFTENITLYAQWTMDGHMVTFDANGGTGTMEPQIAKVETPLNVNTFTRASHFFTGWTTNADGTGTFYTNGAPYSFAADITLYAKWQQTSAISGNIGVEGVTVTYTGGSTTSGPDGSYSFSVPLNWSGTTTFAKTGYTFNPAGYTYSNITTDQVNQNSTPLPQVTISGHVAPGVTINYTGGQTTTNGSGDYSFIVDNGWSGTVTPVKTGNVFNPSNRSYTNLTSNQTNQDFTLQARVSGTVGVSGVTITYTGGTATSDSSGNYSFDVNVPWIGVITPSKTDYTFTPANSEFTSPGLATNTTVNFTANGSFTYTALGTSRSGYVRESAYGSGVGGFNNPAGSLYVGDSPGNLGFRSIIGFNTNSIPDNAVIDDFSFMIAPTAVNGEPSSFGPAGNPSAITLQIRSGCFSGNCLLENGDYEASVGSTVGYLDFPGYSENQPFPLGYQVFTFMTSLSHINKAGNTEFKLKYQQVTDGDGVADRIGFDNAEQALPPKIVVNFHVNPPI